MDIEGGEGDDWLRSLRINQQGTFRAHGARIYCEATRSVRMHPQQGASIQQDSLVMAAIVPSSYCGVECFIFLVSRGHACSVVRVVVPFIQSARRSTDARPVQQLAAHFWEGMRSCDWTLE